MRARDEVSCLQWPGWWVLGATLEPRFLSEHGAGPCASQIPVVGRPTLTRADEVAYFFLINIKQQCVY